MSTLSLTRNGNGVLLKYGDTRLGLDTGLKGTLTLLSHSHSDHTSTLDKASRVVATKGTIDTLRARGGSGDYKVTTIEYGNTILEEGVMITALNAGHVLGSTMYLAEFDGGPSVLYTGDFNVNDSLVHKAATATHADVLVMEATYGEPQWVFPDRREIYRRVITEADNAVDSGSIPRFKAYSLGKAQEAIALLESGGFSVFSGNSSIDGVSRAYRKHGIDLKAVPITSADATDLTSGKCAIVTSSPFHTARTLASRFGRKAGENLESLMKDYHLSGWALTELSWSGIPLSAHTDFNGLIDFAEKVGPRIVYTFTGFSAEFASHLSRHGISAVPIL